MTAAQVLNDWSLSQGNNSLNNECQMEQSERNVTCDPEVEMVRCPVSKQVDAGHEMYVYTIDVSQAYSNISICPDHLRFDRIATYNLQD